MHINSFSNDLQALARAHSSGDSQLLQTPSNKIKANTLYERMIGRGKQLISRLNGESYELKKISYDVAKEKIQQRFNAQLLFFCGKADITKAQKQSLYEISEKLINSMIESNVIFDNPKKALRNELNNLLKEIQNKEKAKPETTALNRLKNLYRAGDNSASFHTRATEFDRIHNSASSNPAITNKNVAITIAAINHTERLGSFAERAHKGGASKDEAFLIATLALNPIFTDSDSDDTRYGLAVSTFVHAVDRGISDFDKIKKILVLKKEEAEAELELQTIIGNLRLINSVKPDVETTASGTDGNAAMKNTPFTADKSSISETGRKTEALAFYERAVNGGATEDEAKIIGKLMTDPSLANSGDTETRYSRAANAVWLANINNINGYENIKKIFTLKNEENIARTNLQRIRNEIHGVQSET